KGWATLQPCFGPMVGFFLVIFLINVVLANIPVVGKIAPGVIYAPLSAGSTFVVLAILRGQSFEFKDFFKGLSNKYFLQLFLIFLVGGLLTIVGVLFFLIPGIYLFVSYVFAVQFAVDWDLEFFQALEASRKLVSRQWLQVFVLLILIGLMNILGLLLLGVGIFVTAPLSICIIVCLYNDIAGNTLNSATEEA
ncbi:MAG: hypothetical protein ACK45T_25285, partial [Pseudanabaena sp.]